MLRGAVILLLALLAGCSEEPRDSSLAPENATLALGKFRLTGSAESGQYALQLFKVDRMLVQEMARNKGWQVKESDRISELVGELQFNTQEEPGRTDQLLDNLLEKATGVKAAKKDATAPKFSSADYLLVGEMDGFDVYYDDSPQTINGVVRTLKTRTRKARSRISFRVVDVRNRKWLYTHSRNIEVNMPDDRNAESQVDLALSAMVQEAVATIGQKEQLPVVSAATGQAALPKVKQVRVAFGGMSIYHPEITTDLDELKKKVATDVIINVQGGPKNYDQVQDIADNYVKGGIVPFSALIKMAPIVQELEAMLTHRLKKSTGLKVIDQETGRLKKLLAQQVLTDLSKKRQPGLPMGTLQGVDYLVFGILHDFQLEVSKPKYVDSVKISKGGRPKKGKARIHLYLQDVNTGEQVLSEELNINKSLKNNKTISDAVGDFLTHISDASIQKFIVSMRPLEVMTVDGSNIMLNHGATAGLNVGDKLPIYTAGDNRVDPYTGAILKGVGARQVGQIEVTGFSPSGWAEARLLSGENIAPGYGLRMPQELSAVKTDASVEKNVIKPSW